MMKCWQAHCCALLCIHICRYISHRCSEIMRITTISCSEDIFLQLTSPSSSSSVLFVPLPRFPRPRRGWYRYATLAENFAISYSKLFDRFRVSRFPGNKKLLWQRPRVVLICGYKHEYLEGIWPHLFSKAAVMSFPWRLWSSLVYSTQHMLSSAQGSGLRCHQEAWFPPWHSIPGVFTGVPGTELKSACLSRRNLAN